MLDYKLGNIYFIDYGYHSYMILVKSNKKHDKTGDYYIVDSFLMKYDNFNNVKTEYCWTFNFDWYTEDPDINGEMNITNKEKSKIKRMSLKKLFK